LHARAEKKIFTRTNEGASVHCKLRQRFSLSARGFIQEPQQERLLKKRILAATSTAVAVESWQKLAAYAVKAVASDCARENDKFLASKKLKTSTVAKAVHSVLVGLFFANTT
jgi:hypothetical protein